MNLLSFSSRRPDLPIFAHLRTTAASHGKHSIVLTTCRKQASSCCCLRPLNRDLMPNELTEYDWVNDDLGCVLNQPRHHLRIGHHLCGFAEDDKVSDPSLSGTVLSIVSPGSSGRNQSSTGSLEVS